MKTLIFISVIFSCFIVAESLDCSRAFKGFDPNVKDNTCPNGDQYCFTIALKAKTDGASIDGSITGCSSDLNKMGLNELKCDSVGKQDLLKNSNINGVSATLDCCNKNSCNSLNGKGNNGNNDGNSAAGLSSLTFHIFLGFLKVII
uniref:UPAR/Ly6 domain-containing protein n=1 Tax=Panagrolaimus davidi TaxID=227884 RepID=A0A914P6E1_9BILA